eukprot:1462641-Pleurochrysis_carterae.AAC.2
MSARMRAFMSARVRARTRARVHAGRLLRLSPERVEGGGRNGEAQALGTTEAVIRDGCRSRSTKRADSGAALRPALCMQHTRKFTAQQSHLAVSIQIPTLQKASRRAEE